MSDVVIRVENLGKQYRIGGKQERYKTFRESITRTLRAPIQRLTAGRRAARSETFWALKDVSFEVKRGEVLGVIGRNGAGKSTLLKILSRITEPTEGAVYLKGRVGSLLEVGTGFHPELTGRENIYLNGAILGMRRAEIARKFDEIVDFAEIEQFIDTPVKRYSSGMYTRLAFSVAAHLEPEILLVDEVLAVGDAAFQKKCLGKMSEVAGEGRTVLFVSHNMGSLQTLTSKAILLSKGRLSREGVSSDVITEYLHSATQNSDFEVSNLPRVAHTYGSECRIQLIRPSDDSNGSFYFGRALGFEVVVSSQRDREGLRFGITVLDMGGAPIFTGFTRELINLANHNENKFHISIPDSRARSR